MPRRAAFLPPKAEVKDLKAKVVEAIREKFSLEQACRSAGLSRRVVFRWRQEDPEFALACEDAKQSALDVLESSLYERALNSDLKYEQKTAAILGIYLHKGNRPEYKDSYRPEVASGEIRFTFLIPKPETLKLPEHVIEGEVVSAD